LYDYKANPIIDQSNIMRKISVYDICFMVVEELRDRKSSLTRQNMKKKEKHVEKNIINFIP